MDEILSSIQFQENNNTNIVNVKKIDDKENTNIIESEKNNFNLITNNNIDKTDSVTKKNGNNDYTEVDEKNKYITPNTKKDNFLNNYIYNKKKVGIITLPLLSIFLILKNLLKSNKKNKESEQQSLKKEQLVKLQQPQFQIEITNYIENSMKKINDQEHILFFQQHFKDLIYIKKSKNLDLYLEHVDEILGFYVESLNNKHNKQYIKDINRELNNVMEYRERQIRIIKEKLNIISNNNINTSKDKEEIFETLFYAAYMNDDQKLEEIASYDFINKNQLSILDKKKEEIISYLNKNLFINTELTNSIFKELYLDAQLDKISDIIFNEELENKNDNDIYILFQKNFKDLIFIHKSKNLDLYLENPQELFDWLNNSPNSEKFNTLQEELKNAEAYRNKTIFALLKCIKQLRFFLYETLSTNCDKDCYKYDNDQVIFLQSFFYVLHMNVTQTLKDIASYEFIKNINDDKFAKETNLVEVRKMINMTKAEIIEKYMLNFNKSEMDKIYNFLKIKR